MQTALAPLSAVAADNRIALLAVTHQNKSGGTTAL